MLKTTRVPSRPRFWLAEDSEAVRRVAEKVLTRLGARVIAVADGQQAVDRFATDPGQFRPALLDIMMPGLSGFEVAPRACRSLSPDIPVLFASGYAAESLGAKTELTANDTILRKTLRSRFSAGGSA